MEEDELTIEQRDLSIKAGEKQSMVFASKIKAVNFEKGTVDVIMSDASIDRYREVIDPRAWKKGLANYKKHPVLLSSHNYHGLTNQIGKAETIKVNKEGQLEARMKYFIGKGNDEADWGFFLAEEGVAAYSVGFIPKKYVWSGDGDFDDLAKELGYSAKEAAGIRVIFTEVELLENSQVLVPANPAGLLKGMESEEVQNDTLLKSLYTEALDKIDSFKDFFETEGAATISKNFGEWPDEKEPTARVKRVKKEDTGAVVGITDVLAAIKTLGNTKKEDKELIGDILLAVKDLGTNKDTKEDEPEVDKTNVGATEKDVEDEPSEEATQKEADLAELLVSLKDLEGKDGDSREVAAFWVTTAEKGFTADEVFAAVDLALESGGPASPEVKDAEELEAEEEELSPEVEAIKDATDSAVEKINAALKTAIEQFSSLTIESTKTTAKLEEFENELSVVKDLLTDLEENKIEVKDVEAVTKESMKELLSGIKDATAKIETREVSSEKD